jgi:hypothetical protein
MKEHSVLGAKILEPLRALKNIQKIVAPPPRVLGRHGLP